MLRNEMRPATLSGRVRSADDNLKGIRNAQPAFGRNGWTLPRFQRCWRLCRQREAAFGDGASEFLLVALPVANYALWIRRSGHDAKTDRERGRFGSVGQ